ncbi:MAG: hypothetical protein GY788_14845 [bacterium]|nr:hypothetical protein [bacterium]
MLQIVKSSGVNTATIGTVITYTYQVQNLSLNPINNVSAIDN